MESGIYNKLSSILINENLLIIPDLQRDYCWGSIKPKGEIKTLAYSFCNDLLEAAKSNDPLKKSKLSYGIIYTYEYPQTFFYLCDGQQRLTTFYLIIGILNCYLNDEKINNLLVTENGQARLKYEVRSTTDYFIKDLVNKVFLSNDTKNVKNIKKANWYRVDYLDDPSVDSMVKAIEDIDSIINQENALLLAEFILNSIGFVYVNLKANKYLENDTYTKIREYGEKMYEIVNTSGDPISPNEHEKVNLLSKLADTEKEEWTEKWETWQDFFWQHRAEKHQSADEGFNEFLDWSKLIIGKKETLSGLEKLETIENVFKGIFLWSNIQDDLSSHRNAHIFNIKENLKKNDPSKTVVILPTLQYLKDTNSVHFIDDRYFVDKKSVNLDSVFRVIRFFTNVSKNTNSAVTALSISRKLNPYNDITRILDSPITENELILTNEELFKLKLYKQSSDSERRKMEDVFWLAEDNDYLHGKVEPVFRWMSIEYNKIGIETFSINTFQGVYKTFNSLFDNKEKIEMVRLCMLALNNNWEDFAEGWSWGKRRYYLGLKNDLGYWREKITFSFFNDIVINEINETLTNKFIDEQIMNLENVEKRKVVRNLRDQATVKWQWNNNKRFFFNEKTLFIPNGIQAKSNTEEIDI